MDLSLPSVDSDSSDLPDALPKLAWDKENDDHLSVTYVNIRDDAPIRTLTFFPSRCRYPYARTRTTMGHGEHRSYGGTHGDQAFRPWTTFASDMVYQP